MAEKKGFSLHFSRLALWVAVLGSAGGLQATTYNLTPSGDLQGTLNLSAAGDVINLAPGTYTMKTGEPYFHVDNGITLQGTGGSGATSIQAPNGAFSGLDIRNSNTTVKGITVNGGSFGVVVATLSGAPIGTVTLFDLVINSIPLSSSPGHGITVAAASNVTIDTCTVGPAQASGISVSGASNNVIIRNTQIQGAITSQGIAVQNSSGAQISNTTVNNIAASGIYLQFAPGATVTGVTIGTVGQHGVYIQDSNNVSVSSTTVANAAQNGIVAQAQSQPSVTGTSLTGDTITAAGQNGILLTTAVNAVISNCTVTQAGGNGIFVQTGSTGVTIQNAVVKTTGQQGIAVLNSGSAQIFNSSVSSAAASTSNGILLNLSPNSTVDTATIGTVGLHGIDVLDSDNVIVRNSTVASAGANGISVQSVQNSTVGSPLVYNNTITKTVSQGIFFGGVTHGTIDSNTVTHAAGGLGALSSNGIYLDAGVCGNQACGSTGNLVINNTVIRADTHGLVNKNSTFNTWAGNTVLSTGFHGMELIGSSYNRVDRNNLTGFSVDGITLAIGDDANKTHSLSNYIGKNTIVSNGKAAGRSDGTGIWLEFSSNNTFVFGNTESGDVEGGITSFNSSNSYIRANLVSGNGQAGLLMWNQDPSQGSVQNSTIQNNYIFNNPSQGLILMRGAQHNDIGYNFMSAPVLSPTPGNDPGITLVTWNGAGQATGTTSGPSTNSTIYRNTLLNLKTAVKVGSDTTSILIFENRFINSPDLYSDKGAGVSWENQVYMGGNFYGSANPPAGQPYTNFIIDAVRDRGGIDRFPLPNELFGLPYSITMQEPVVARVAAAGSQKTIAWQSTGCFLIDLSYSSTSTGASGFIAQGWPDIGFYHWTVPAVPAAADYTIRADCKNSSNAAIGLSATTAPFTIAPATLILLSPGRDLMVNSDQPVRVSWARGGGFTAPVNIFLSTTTGGAWTQVGSNVSGDFLDIPATALTGVNSNRASVLIQAASGGNGQDSVDGYFTIRGGTATFTNPGGAGPVSFAMKSAVDLEWISPQNSYLVTLDLFDATANQFVNITTKLPDYGKYTWLVPELWITGGYIRATFLDASGNVLSATPLNSGPVNLRYTTAPGVLEPFYRLYSPVTNEHLYTTDSNEYNVLGTFVGTWTQEGEIGQILNGPASIGGVEATPYYRLYNSSNLQHHWTTDRNEYFTLRQYANYSPEGPIGYVFDSAHPVTGSVPLYRLVYNYPPYYHLWTLDANEKNVLSAGGGWTYENVAANIFCAPNNVIYAGCSTSLPNLPAVVLPPVSGGVSISSLNPAAITNNRMSAVTTQKPVLQAVLNGASFEAGPLAPGQTVSLLGQWLGPAAATSAQFQGGDAIGNTLGGVRVLVDGEAAPLLYASAAELKAIIPYDTSGKKSVQVRVEYQGGTSADFEVATAPSAPGIFTADKSGKGQAAALNEDNSLNSAMNPAGQGSVILLFATGEGLTDPALAAGTVPTPDNLPKPLLPVAVQIGGQPAEVLHAGAVAGSPGVMQLYVRISPGTPVGPAIPVTVKVGSATSQSTVTLALY